MNSKERIAYLRGLLDFLPREEKETKIYSAIAEALESLALELEEHSKLLELQREDYDSLAEEMDELHEAVYNLEESVGLEDSEDGIYGSDGAEELDGLTESYISMTCPPEEGKDVCPNCGEKLDRSL